MPKYDDVMYTYDDVTYMAQGFEEEMSLQPVATPYVNIHPYMSMHIHTYDDVMHAYDDVTYVVQGFEEEMPWTMMM